MANVYVRSAAAGAGTGADWENAYTTLAAAFAAKAAGDVFFVADDHAETQASVMNLTCPGTSVNPCYVYCVDRAGSVPPVSADLRTTATITTTGGNALNYVSGTAEIYGITFSGSSGVTAAGMAIMSSASVDGWMILKNCALKRLGTNASASAIAFGGSATGLNQKVTLINTTVQIGNAGDRLDPRCDFVWLNTPGAVAGATLPAVLFSAGSAIGHRIYLEGVDLSAIASGSTIFGKGESTKRRVLKNCKLANGVTISESQTTQAGSETMLLCSDSSGTNYRNEKYDYMGEQTVETTIVRTGGASDGTTTIAWKIVTSANAKWIIPFESFPVAVWNDNISGNVTLTFCGIWGGGAVPNNDDIWMELSYMDSAATPIASFATSTKADNLATGSALASDTSTWGGSTTKFKMSVTITPAMKGPIYAIIKAAKASSTFYIDPKPEVS